jgi:DNA-binding transcriptional LysR family regulator
MHAAALRYLEEVARAGSIRQAAERLNVAASAVNRQILKLEDEFGVQLFERLPRGLRLTPAGDLAVRHARATLHDFERLRGEISELKGVKSGSVRIACLDSLLAHFLPDVITGFQHRHPAVTYLVEGGTHGHIVHLVAAGDADIGITFNLEHHPDLFLSSDIAMPIMAMMAPDHPLAGRRRVTLDDCAPHPMLLQKDTQPIRSVLDSELMILAKRRQPIVACNNMALLKQLVLNGVGIAFYTPIGFLREIDAGTVRAVPMASPAVTRLRVGLLLHRRRRPTPAASALADAIGDALAALSRQMAAKPTRRHGRAPGPRRTRPPRSEDSPQ